MEMEIKREKVIFIPFLVNELISLLANKANGCSQEIETRILNYLQANAIHDAYKFQAVCNSY